jgi:hypothetical protein
VFGVFFWVAFAVLCWVILSNFDMARIMEGGVAQHLRTFLQLDFAKKNPAFPAEEEHCCDYDCFCDPVTCECKSFPLCEEMNLGSCVSECVNIRDFENGPLFGYCDGDACRTFCGTEENCIRSQSQTGIIIIDCKKRLPMKLD